MVRFFRVNVAKVTLMSEWTTNNTKAPELIDAGWFIGGMADLQGMWGLGDTPVDAEQDFIEAIRGWALICRERETPNE